MSLLGSRPITLTPRSVKSLVEIPVPHPTSTITVEPDILQVDMIKSTASGGYVGREAAYMFASPEKRSVDFILLSLVMEACFAVSIFKFYRDFIQTENLNLSGFLDTSGPLWGKPAGGRHPLISIVLCRKKHIVS